MNSAVISWGLFLTLAGGIYWVYFSPKSATRLRPKPVVEDKGAGSIFLSAGGAEGAGTNEKKKKKKKKSALSNTAPKDIVSTDDGFKAAESTDDEDVVQEEDQAKLLRRLQNLKEGSSTGNKKFASTSSSTRQLVPQKSTLAAPASPFATASQTSSAGADADIDEEETTQLPGSDFSPLAQQSLSSDPSDMLEASTGGPGVLKITSSTQLPRIQKQKTTSTVSQPGVHSSKNTKKKEKKKVEKDAEKADQKARLELHHATMKAAEAAKQKGKPQAAALPPASVWTGNNNQASSTAHKSAAVELLDTFTVPEATGVSVATPHTPTDSEEDKQQMRSTHLGDSYWEEIPEHLIGGWNEVQKKGRKQKKVTGEVQASKSEDESTDARSAKETFQSKIPTKVPSKAASKVVKPVPKRETSVSGNGYQLLDTGSATSNANNSSSDWAEVDDLDNWAVHPEE